MLLFLFFSHSAYVDGLWQLLVRDVNVIVADAHENRVVLKFVAIAFLQSAWYDSAKNCSLPIRL